eukprot:scpid109008/ scgid32269/ 
MISDMYVFRGLFIVGAERRHNRVWQCEGSVPRIALRYEQSGSNLTQKSLFVDFWRHRFQALFLGMHIKLLIVCTNQRYYWCLWNSSGAHVSRIGPGTVQVIACVQEQYRFHVCSMGPGMMQVPICAHGSRNSPGAYVCRMGPGAYVCRM